MAKNLAAVISKANGEFELVEREIPQPGAGEIRIKVEACGVCHSDAIVKRGAFPWLKYPLVPGHEVVGFVDEVGSGVTEWKKGTTWEWDGTAAIVLCATGAGAETL